MFFKAKIIIIIIIIIIIAKIYYVLKATNGETQARIKKIIEKRVTTTKMTIW